MNDTGKEREKVPAHETPAANNNVEDATEAPVATEAVEPSAETRVAVLEAELAEQKDQLLRALAGGVVIEVLQPGYLLHDRLLRPAMVGVAKENQGPGEPAESASTVA